MTLLPPNVKMHMAYGYTDMRKGMDGLALLVQEVLLQGPFSGHLFFRGRKANLIKGVFWDGTALCWFTKRLEHELFLRPPNGEPERTLALTSAQLAALLEGIDWHCPERQWRSAVRSKASPTITARPLTKPDSAALTTHPTPRTMAPRRPSSRAA